MDTAAEAPFNLVDDVDKSSGSNDFQMSMNGVAAKQSVELPDDGTWSMGYKGNEKGSDKLPIAISGAKIARVTANLSAAKKAATVTWTVEPTAKEVKQPGETEPGADSAVVQAAVAKDAKNWTLGEQKAVAEDIAAKGESSPVYAKAKAAMDAGTTWSIMLPNDRLEYRIIGINHDDLADGSGKAGLTFLTTSTIISLNSRMNATDTNAGGWEKSELRAKMNSGEIWDLMPSDFQSKVTPVRKLTNNVGGGDENKNAAVTATSDKLFLLSYSEIVPTSYWASDYPWTSSEGTQYEAFKDKVTENNSNNSAIGALFELWECSVSPDYSGCFLAISGHGNPTYPRASAYPQLFCPAWCF